MIHNRFVLGCSVLIVVTSVVCACSNPLAQQDSQDTTQYRAEYQDDEADCYIGNGIGTGICYDVFTEATDMEMLARFTEEIVLRGGHETASVVRIFFHRPGDYDSTFATAFYFGDVEPNYILSRVDRDNATVWHGIYVFRGQVLS